MAVRTPCPRCEAMLTLREHALETVDDEVLRVARMTCASCGVPRDVWFRLLEPLQS